MLRLSSPLYCYLELTPDCNNQCPGCGNVFINEKSARNVTSSSYLDANHWRSIICKLKPYVKRLRITGGEATLHPEFEVIINCLQECGIPFVVFTNGRWHDPERLASFLSQQSRFQGLLVSLHGSDSESHEAFSRIKGSYKETINNISYASQRGIQINTNTVITRANLGQIPEIVTLSQMLGAKHAIFNRYVGQPIPGLSVEPNELKKTLRQIDQMKKSGENVKLSGCVPQCFQSNSSSGCLAGNAFWSIDPWGNVRPCNHAPLICGNLLTQSVEEISTSTAMESWNGLIPDQCPHCSLFSSCHGGCRAQAVLLGREKDDLARMPVRRIPNEEKMAELVLASSARPINLFEERREEFGYILMQGNNIVPVSADGKALLDECNGHLTLGEIDERFGAEALDFVASLYTEGFIDLAQDASWDLL